MQITPLAAVLAIVSASLLSALVVGIWLDRRMRHRAEAPRVSPSHHEAKLEGVLPRMEARLNALERSQRALQARLDLHLLGEHAPTVARRTTVAEPSVRPAPCAAVAESAEAPLELSDAEIDALPPDLPGSDKPRKRVLPAPRRQSLHKL